MKQQHHPNSQDPRSSRESVTSKLAAKLGGASYRLDDSAHDRPGSHPSYAKPDQFTYQQPSVPVHAQPGQYVDPRIQAQINAGQIPPVLPPDWAPIPPSEMPGYVPPGAHPPTSRSIPGAFPGGYPATSARLLLLIIPRPKDIQQRSHMQHQVNINTPTRTPNIGYASKGSERQAYPLQVRKINSLLKSRLHCKH